MGLLTLDGCAGEERTARQGRSVGNCVTNSTASQARDVAVAGASRV